MHLYFVPLEILFSSTNRTISANVAHPLGLAEGERSTVCNFCFRWHRLVSAGDAPDLIHVLTTDNPVSAGRADKSVNELLR